MSTRGKRILLCLDGTWDNSDNGYEKPTWQNSNATLQVPSNVTRLYRALKTEGLDGKRQVMYYQPGVGTGGNLADMFAGGAFGSGISEHIREAYSFVATNYEPGDEIVIVGFSRGAFTARSVAGLIAEIGLLSRNGMEYFYPIFKDAENSQNPHYKDKFPTVPFPNKPRPPNHEEEYRRRLVDEGFSRVVDPDGRRIKIRCVAVWDTFYDTSLSNVIECAFQALALDEKRTPFTPAVWERPSNVHTDLRQVWFPGAHGNIGGGNPDQEIANVTMAWMMDQLASIGIAFEEGTIDRIFQENVRYYFDVNKSLVAPNNSKRKPWTQWAISSVYDDHKPVRPWGLGEIDNPVTGFYRLAGETIRTPGMYHRVNPDTALPTPEFLVNTNERIHRSARIRLGLEGLGYDDVGLYKCLALLQEGPWRLHQMSIRTGRLYSAKSDEILEEDRDLRWVWVYIGPRRNTPPETILVEESLGYYERKLIQLNKGRAFYKSLLPDNRSRR